MFKVLLKGALSHRTRIIVGFILREPRTIS